MSLSVPNAVHILQAFNCEACGSVRPSTNAAALQEDGPGSSSPQGHEDARQESDKSKKKGKTTKFERLRITGEKLSHIPGCKTLAQFPRRGSKLGTSHLNTLQLHSMYVWAKLL